MKEIKRYSISAHDFNLWDVAAKSMASFSGEYPDEFYVASEADEAIAALRSENAEFSAEIVELQRTREKCCGNALEQLATLRAELAQVKGDLNIARLERDAKLCSQCPRAPELAQVREENKRLKQYTEHPERCRRWRFVDAEAEDGRLFYDRNQPCTCGLDAALEGK